MKRSKSAAQVLPARFVRTPVARVLQLSTGLLLIGSGAAWAQTSGTPCDTGPGCTPFTCTVTSTNGQSAPPPAPSGFDSHGNSGGTGTGAGAVSITFNGNPNAFEPHLGGNLPTIQVQSIGGSGASGGTASDGDDAPIEGLSGGNGGQGAAGGDITLTVPQGAQVQVIQSGYAPIAAIQAISQGGNGGGGALASFGGTSGTSASGAQGGDVTITFLADANQTGPIAPGVTGAVISNGTGILAQSLGGNGGNGQATFGNLSYNKFGIAGSDADGPGGQVTVNFNSSIVAYSPAFENPSVPSLSSPPSIAPGAGIWAVSAGGNGGSGGHGLSTDCGQGGAGGNASDGGSVAVNVQGGTVATQAGTSFTPAVWAQSLGGIGGAGGSDGFGSGGDAGAGGNGGTVTVINNGALSTARAVKSPASLRSPSVVPAPAAKGAPGAHRAAKAPPAAMAVR